VCEAQEKTKISQNCGHCRHCQSEFTNTTWVEQPLSLTESLKRASENSLSTYTGQNSIQSTYYAADCEPRKMLKNLKKVRYGARRISQISSSKDHEKTRGQLDGRPLPPSSHRI